MKEATVGERHVNFKTNPTPIDGLAGSSLKAPTRVKQDSQGLASPTQVLDVVFRVLLLKRHSTIRLAMEESRPTSSAFSYWMLSSLEAYA